MKCAFVGCEEQSKLAKYRLGGIIFTYCKRHEGQVRSLRKKSRERKLKEVEKENG